MPVWYEFRCVNPECPTTVFTLALKMGETQGAVCPVCGQRVKQLYNPPIIHGGDTPKFHKGAV